jgi:hypothetical protein
MLHHRHPSSSLPPAGTTTTTTTTGINATVSQIYRTKTIVETDGQDHMNGELENEDDDLIENELNAEGADIERDVFGNSIINVAKEERRHRNKYRRFLLKRRKYTGQLPWIRTKGNGHFEDYVRLVCNEHLILAMIFADSLHPYSRDKRKIAFFTLTSITFCLIVSFQFNSLHPLQFTTSFTNFWNIPFIGSAFLITPIMLTIDILMYQLVVCPCIVRKSRTVRYTRHILSSFTQLAFLSCGIGALMLGLYLQGHYLDGGSDPKFLFQVSNYI